MAVTQEELFQRLEALGIATTTHRHPPVFTVEEAKALRGTLAGGHCKSLFFKDKKGRLILLVCLEDRPLDLKALPALIGSARLSFARPEVLRAVLGVEPGSVTPFALINDADLAVDVVLDKAMLAQTPLNYHPLSNDATTQIAPDDLVRFIRALGHEPRIVDLDGAA